MTIGYVRQVIGPTVDFEFPADALPNILNAITIKDFFVTRAYDNSGGYDVASLYDTKYQEVFEASPTMGRLYGDKMYLQARGFDEVHAYSRLGGDVAQFQDSAGDDLFVGKADDEICKLSGDGFFLRAKFFDEVYAESTAGGNDSAILGDSAEDDLLVAQDDWARLSSIGGGLEYLYEVKGFDPIEAKSTNGGTDTAHVDPGINFDLDTPGNWN